MRTRLFLLGIVLSSGCGAVEDAAVQGRAPALGKADSLDQADRSCKVVLRGVGREPGGEDYLTHCSGGVCNYVWKGAVEVAEGVSGTVRVLYRRAGDPSWWQVTATPAANGSPGYTRWDFGIHEHLFGPGQSPSPIELMPYLELADGTRLFDHNRRSGDFENYRIDDTTSWGLGEENACRPVAGRISFFASWSHHASGELRQGGYLVVDYDLGRLPQCRGTHNGQPAWDIVAHARFLPGGQQLSGSVRELDSHQGTPTNSATSKPLTLKIPADASAVELWFHNYTGAGSSCQAWDSSFGKNYRFEVWPAATDPRCKNVERWSSWASDMPYRSDPHCLDYTVARNLDASRCELYLSGIGNGTMGHYGIPNHWVEAYLSVGPQQGQLLAAGMFTRYHDPATKSTGERITIGYPFAPGVWLTGFKYDHPGMMGSGAYHFTVEKLAFFVDVRRPTGEVERLWQSRKGANYSWSDAFGGATSAKSIPYGNIQYATESAPVFDAKKACSK